MLEFAATWMKWNTFHHLPFENAQGEISELISTKDVEAWRNSQPMNGALVNACMTTNVFTVSPDASLDEAEQVMASPGFGSVRVVHEKRVVGIVTVNDLRWLPSQEERGF